MKRYAKNPFLGQVFIPGVGQLKEGMHIMGEYDHLVPKFLVEVPEEPKMPVRKPLEARPAPPPVVAPPRAPVAQQPLESSPPDRGPKLLVDQHNVKPLSMSEPAAEKSLDEQKPGENEEEKPARGRRSKSSSGG